jgi:transketolase C-terminal domain/subunit
MVGVGLGLAVQGLVMFLLDWTVLDRARAYENALEKYPL